MSSAIVDLAIELLRVDASGEQRLVWAPRAEDGIAKIIDTLFEFPTETRAGIDDLIRLVCALELELRSPQTAARLRTMLQSDPRVVSLCDLRRSEELRAQ